VVVVRGRCAMKMQWRVGVGIEVEVVCSWSSEEKKCARACVCILKQCLKICVDVCCVSWLWSQADQGCRLLR
jgi:hypothetical protein